MIILTATAEVEVDDVGRKPNISNDISRSIADQAAGFFSRCLMLYICFYFVVSYLIAYIFYMVYAYYKRCV